MSHFGESTYSYIQRKSGRKPIECNCDMCKSQCHTPCLGTPEDILKLLEEGYKDRIVMSAWYVGMIAGVTNAPVYMFQPNREDNGWCTFYHDGLCELHTSGLKPTEGKLSSHKIRIDNFDFKKSLSWLVAKE